MHVPRRCRGYDVLRRRELAAMEFSDIISPQRINNGNELAALAGAIGDLYSAVCHFARAGKSNVQTGLVFIIADLSWFTRSSAKIPAKIPPLLSGEYR